MLGLRRYNDIFGYFMAISLYREFRYNDSSIFNNYSPKAKWLLLNNPRDEVEGIIQQ